MAPSGSTGAKLLDRNSVIEKYPEMKKRISKIDKHIKKFEEENPEEKKRISKIRRQLKKLQQKLEEDDSDEEVLPAEINQPRVRAPKQPIKIARFISHGYSSPQTFEPDSTHSNLNKVQNFEQSAKVAIGYYNKTSSIKYYVVDVIKATKSPSAGYVLCLTFTAAPENDEKVETFEAKIYYAIGETIVKYVQIVGRQPLL